ncbi:MAG: hypothetical protein IKM90_07090 [Bacteroidaceae bacterium]|jgi:hypothetical protein|nr:hypothetical protein [Bacteroidaceae bacterium]
MKKFFGFVFCFAVCLMTSSCGIFGIGTKNGSASVSGQASGAALKSLYSQYQTDGQIDITNLNNIIMLAQLSNGIQGLKGVDDKSEFYNEFAQGLILGSDRLVTKNTAGTVTNTLQSLVSGTDLSTIAAAGVLAVAGAEQTGAQTTQTAKQTVQETSTQVSSAAKETVSEAVEMIEDATDEVSSTISSLTSIFGLLGK